MIIKIASIFILVSILVLVTASAPSNPARSVFAVSVNPLACNENQIFYNMTSHQFLVCTGVNTLSVVSFGGGGGGITTLNGLTANPQTFATGTSGSDFNIISSGSIHTFNIPSSSVSTRGLLTSTDWNIFNSKQALLGYTPENIAAKNASNGYAGLIGGKITNSQISEVLSVTNLTDYITVSGTGTTAIRATITSPVNTDILTYNGTNWINSPPTGGGGGSGTVTSVGITVPGILLITGSPITTSGTIALSLANESQNTVFAGLTSGIGTPAFRLLVPADIPSIDASKITSGVFNTGRLGTGVANSITVLMGNGAWAIAADMFLGTNQVITAAKTFNSGTLIIGTSGSAPTVVANSLYINTGDGKFYIGSRNGATWHELFEAGVSSVNLVSNVTGVLLPANGGRGLVGSGTNVASAATIAATGIVFHVTGTTTITSVSGSGISAGTEITIIFDGILTFTDGSNLKLAGNFVTAADSTITLAYDGTNWYEKSRSVN